MAAKHKGCVIGRLQRRKGYLYYVTAGGMLVEKKMKHAKGAKSSCASGKSMGLRATGKKTKSRPKRGRARGFAAMSHAEVVKIAKKGGRAASRRSGTKKRAKKTAHRRKKGYVFTAKRKAALKKAQRASVRSRRGGTKRRRSTRKSSRRR